jgi:hypothetical protein
VIGNRGQTQVLGVVLLVGMVAIAAVGIVVLGTSALEAQEATAETERVQGSMVRFAQDTNGVVSAGRGPATTSFGRLEHGHVHVRDGGYVRIVHVADAETELYNASLGAIAYEHEGGEIAYQGGGVWRTDGEGTALVSEPDVRVRGRTLTFPIVRVNGTPSRTTAPEPTVRGVTDRTAVDVPDGDRTAGSFENGALRIELGSEYCDGWERYLEDELDGAVIERCGEARSDRLVAELHAPFGVGGFDSAIAAETVSLHSRVPEIRGDVRTSSADDLEEAVAGTVSTTGYVYPEADAVIDAKLAACDGAFEELPRTVTGPDVRCTTELAGDHTFDTTDGDVEVVVRDGIGDPNYQGTVDVVGEHNVTIYSDGGLDGRGNAVLGNASDPARLRLIVASDRAVSLKGTPTVAGLLYAPGSDVVIQGNPTVSGTVVADGADVGNIRPGRIEYDDRMRTIELENAGPTLRHAHVTAHEVRIEE